MVLFFEAHLKDLPSQALFAATLGMTTQVQRLT
jgi:hypothetical protein